MKAIGSVTTRLQSTRPGEKVYIDGPYGVFSHAALESDRPLVMVAGGIGITPFIRIFEELGYQPDRELHLFYGNKRKKEIIYKDHVENVEHANVIHVLSKEPNPSGKTGYVTADLLEDHLTKGAQGVRVPDLRTSRLDGQCRGGAGPKRRSGRTDPP